MDPGLRQDADFLRAAAVALRQRLVKEGIHPRPPFLIGFVSIITIFHSPDHCKSRMPGPRAKGGTRKEGELWGKARIQGARSRTVTGKPTRELAAAIRSPLPQGHGFPRRCVDRSGKINSQNRVGTQNGIWQTGKCPCQSGRHRHKAGSMIPGDISSPGIGPHRGRTAGASRRRKRPHFVRSAVMVETTGLEPVASCV